MSLIEIDNNPSPAKLRTFGLLLPVFFGCVGAVARWRWGFPATGTTIWTAGAALVLLYVAAPRMRRPIYVGWMYAVRPIGVAVSYFVLAATYFLILTPIGIVRRMFGDPLQRRFDRKAVSYWSPVQRKTGKADYLRQF
ncbi:MAG TPA: SxtJ family membrane protein [Pirellulaceae bacterium]|jgi:hypothetical protein